MNDNRFDRNERLFGKDGQDKLRATRILIAGAGGLGSHVAAQTALLGVGKIDVADKEELSLSNRNRYIGAWHNDPIPGSTKVELAKRHINLIDPDIEVVAINDDILSSTVLGAIQRADYVLGCVDNDGVRFFLNEACLAYEKPLIDLASDVPEAGVFGGHIAIVSGEHGCLHCRDLLDEKEVRQFLSSAELLENEAAVYGIDASNLSETGPSVVSINGVVASLGVTAFMAMATGMKLPYSFLTYRGDLGRVSRQMSETRRDCYYCSVVKGSGDIADLYRYFRKSAA